MRLTHRTQVGATGLLLLFLVMSFSFYSCDEAPVASAPEPVIEEPEPVDYKVWYWNAGNKHSVYSYDVTTGVIDSSSIPWQITGEIAASHDGSLLYIPAESGIKVISTESFQTIQELPYFASHPVIVSPDGEHIAITGNQLVILRTSGYEDVFQADSEYGYGRFSSNGQTLWVSDYRRTNGDVSSFTSSDNGWAIQHYQFDGFSHPYEVMPTPDESKLLLYGNAGIGVSFFAVYDIGLDSITFVDIHDPGFGQIAIAPDGQHAYYGNPGSSIGFHGGPDAPSELIEFDINANQIARRISTLHFVDSITPDKFPIDDIAITPDGRWLIALKGPSGISLLKYDLVNDRFNDYKEIDGMGLSMTIQQAK